NRQIVISREITKMYEQYIRGTCREVIAWTEGNEIKGECCIVLEGNVHNEELKDNSWWKSFSIMEHVQYYEIQEKMSNKTAMKQVAQDRNIPKRNVYQKVHVDK